MENLNEIIEQVKATNDKLENFAEKLDSEKITPKLYRDFEELQDEFSGFSAYIEFLGEDLTELQKTVEETRLKVVTEVIAHLEQQELGLYLHHNLDFCKSLARFDGFLLLKTYLTELTKENDYPLSSNQLCNYVWELIAIDIAKRKQGKKNLLDLWTSKETYQRYMMVQEKDYD